LEPYRPSEGAAKDEGDNSGASRVASPWSRTELPQLLLLSSLAFTVLENEATIIRWQKILLYNYRNHSSNPPLPLISGQRRTGSSGQSGSGSRRNGGSEAAEIEAAGEVGGAAELSDCVGIAYMYYL